MSRKVHQRRHVSGISLSRELLSGHLYADLLFLHARFSLSRVDQTPDGMEFRVNVHAFSSTRYSGNHDRL